MNSFTMLRIGPCGIVAMLLLAGCATPKPPGAPPSNSQPSADLTISSALFQLPYSESARSSWLAYAGFRLLWEQNHYQGMRHDWKYQETPDEELDAMDVLAQGWSQDKQHKPGDDDYLDTIAAARDAGYLTEYVWVCKATESWGQPPASVRIKDFQGWMLVHAHDFSVLSAASPHFDGTKMTLFAHEPLATRDCVPPAGKLPDALTLAADDAKLDAAVKLLQAGSDQEAETLLQAVHSDYAAAVAQQGGSPHCFDTAAEYLGYRNTHPDERLLVVSRPYCDSMHLLGYLQSGRHEWSAAMETLASARQMAPYDTGSLTEMAYVTQATKGPADAIPVYLQALKIAETNLAHQSGIVGIDRRIGEAEIDLQHYDEARDWLNMALSWDPDDAGSKRELQYLEQVSGKH